MADSCNSLTIDKLKQLLTCSQCKDPYDNPKTLPCLHSFCLKCIQQLPAADDQICCPICGLAADANATIATDLPSTFIIGNMLQIQGSLRLANVCSGGCGNCDASNATRYCKQCATVYCEECLVHHSKLKVNISHQVTNIEDITSNVYSIKQDTVIMNCIHHNKPLEIFCETCQDLVCLTCVIHGQYHKDHTYDTVSDLFAGHRKQIESTLQLVKQKIAATNEALAALEKREEKISKQGEDTMKEIHQFTQQIVASIQQYEKLLLRQVDVSVKRKLKSLGEQVKEVETALVKLKSCEEYVEQGLEVGSPQQILLEKQMMIQGMGVVSEPINPHVFQPVEQPDITFNGNKVLVDSYKDIGKVKCSFSYPPSKFKKVIEGLDKPRCVAVNGEGVMVVGGWGNSCITVIDKDGTIVRSFGLYGKDIDRSGVCRGVGFTSDGHIIVSNDVDNSLHKLTLQGEHITSVGGEGSGPLEFKYPRGIAVHPTTGQIYVVDCDNHRIQVINDDLTYSHGFGSKGTEPGQLYLPCDVALDNAGNIYVCNAGKTLSSVFTSDGTFIRHFGSSSDNSSDNSSDDSSPSSIFAITVDQYNFIYGVDDESACILLFASDGQFIKSICSNGSGDGQLDFPWGAAVNAQGSLYVTDCGNNRLVIF